MKLSQKQQNTIGYHSIPNAIAADDDETATVPLGTPPSTTMTIDRRLSKWRMMVAIVAGMMMILLVVAADTVWMLQDVSSYDHSSGSLETTDGDRKTIAEGLIIAVPPIDPKDNICFPASGAFGGVSTTTCLPNSDPFETCYQYGSYDKYCWTKSFFDTFGFHQCRTDMDKGTKSRRI